MEVKSKSSLVEGSRLIQVKSGHHLEYTSSIRVLSTGEAEQCYSETVYGVKEGSMRATTLESYATA